MPTIMSHAFVPLAVAAAAGRGRIAVPVAVTGAILAIIPDADVIGFRYGIEYADAWGHRGASHSLVFGTVLAAFVSLVWQSARRLAAFLFLAFAAVSHGLLDTLTDGGLGAALWWPFDDGRVFAAITPIRVSPIGAGFFSMRGIETLLSELVWIGAPCVVLAFGGLLARRAMS